jgi:hypothetical protein
VQNRPRHKLDEYALRSHELAGRARAGSAFGVFEIDEAFAPSD